MTLLPLFILSRIESKYNQVNHHRGKLTYMPHVIGNKDFFHQPLPQPADVKSIIN
jgi:hypothetical protein